MDIQLASRVQRVKPSPTMSITAHAEALRATGKDVISLSAGEPDFDTPEHIKAAAVAAITRGETKYTAVDGTPSLKRAVRAKLRRDQGLDYGEREILVSSGAKHGIFNLVCALLNPGDEAIIPAPYWVSYPDMVRLVGARPITVSADQAQGFKITAEQLEAAVTPRSRLFVLNSPNNPSGAVYSREELAELGRVLERHPDIVVLTDDIYEHITWGDTRFVSLLTAAPSLRERTVIVNGVSKAYAMTGWRIGYAAGPEPLIGAMGKLQSQSTSNPCSVSQAATEAALNGDQSCIEPMRAAYRNRHDFVTARLDALQGVTCRASGGTFYCLPNVEGAIERTAGVETDVELAEYLLEQAGVALVPGSAFGLPGHLRLSFAAGMELLETAMERLSAALGTDSAN